VAEPGAAGSDRRRFANAARARNCIAGPAGLKFRKFDAVENSTKTWTLLYVEDDENDVLFMEMALRRAGLQQQFRCVRNGQEALDYLSGTGDYAQRDQHPLPVLLLLDLNLPAVSGFEVLAWLRKQPQFQSLPVVIFSSSSRPEDRQRALELGANDYVQKPASGMKFGEVLDHLRSGWLG
jgi:CheY-like chemotaxis protein